VPNIALIYIRDRKRGIHGSQMPHFLYTYKMRRQGRVGIQ
jgi:hypothetical protein